MAIVLLCACGKRVRAPGAVPGRTGRCPACGARLQVPATLPIASSSEDVEVFAGDPGAIPALPPGASHPPRDRKPPARGKGYGLQPDLAGSPPRENLRPQRAPVGDGLATRPQRRAERTSTSARSRTDDDDEMETPRRESGLRDNLAYPFRDTPALLFLAILSPICAILSIFSFGLRGYLTGGDEVSRLGALTMAFPMISLLGLFAGFGGLFLIRVLETTSQGETGQPRVPGWILSEIATALGRFAVACAPGMIVGYALAACFARARGGWGTVLDGSHIGDEMIAMGLIGLGAALGPFPILAVILHGDIRAANPWTVLNAARRSGFGAVGISLLFGIAGMSLAVLADVLFLLPRAGGLAVLFGVSLYWGLFWYAAIVLMRRLGLFYRRRARAIGWFPERPRWGA